MPTRIKVRHVQFSPEEMAYDPTPEETEDWMPVGRGPADVFAKPSKALMALWRHQLAQARTGYVRIDADLRKQFKDAASVNNALRKLVETSLTSGRQKKTA